MKKLYVILLILFLTSSVPAISQNVQLHYRTGQWLYPDTLGKDARILTTVEMYAYWEIARNLKFWDAPVAVHLEYNGGLLGSILFNHSWLAGVNYGIASKDGSKSFSVSAMYKYIQGLARPSNFQLTAIWNMELARGKCTFSGFVDWWRQGDTYILLSQPQFWVNLNAFEGISDSFCLSVGTEVELYNNLFHKGFYVIPSLAVKWTFR